MNYNWTDRARKVLRFAREEAIALEHDYVGTEHILLGLVHEGDGVGMAVLRQSFMTADTVRDAVLESVRPGKASIAVGELPYTGRAKKAMEFAMAAARDLNHTYIGTEHLLIGLLREEGEIAAQVLNRGGLTFQMAVDLVGRVLAGDVPDVRTTAYRITIDDTSEVSICEQIIAQVQEGVATGLLRPGDRLPAVGQLADELNIAPGTVACAYSELESRGVVVTEDVRGSRIANRNPEPLQENEREETLTGLLRPVAVAAFHLGATADALRTALERAMRGIFPATDPGAQ